VSNIRIRVQKIRGDVRLDVAGMSGFADWFSDPHWGATHSPYSIDFAYAYRRKWRKE